MLLFFFNVVFADLKNFFFQKFGPEYFFLNSPKKSGTCYCYRITYSYYRIESPNKTDLSKHQIDLKFPANHPYHSHIPSKDLFPSNNPIDRESPGNCLGATQPASAPALTVLEKTRGNGKRHEQLTIPLNSKRQPMAWPKGPTYFQVQCSFPLAKFLNSITTNYCLSLH